MDKLTTIITWLLPRLKQSSRRPYIIGLSGVQGSGKTYIVTQIQRELREKGYKTEQLSLDDLYLPHTEQVKLARANPANELWQSRGQFGTHDVALSAEFMRQVKTQQSGTVKLPSYDKSQFAGQGDRVDDSEWTMFESPIDCLILEGWGIGFESLGQDLQSTWNALSPNAKARQHPFSTIQAIDHALEQYVSQFMTFDAIIALSPLEVPWVYDWRQEQEVELHRRTGRGMTHEQVVAFVDRYYPSYDLYLPRLLMPSDNKLIIWLEKDRKLSSFEGS